MDKEQILARINEIKGECTAAASARDEIKADLMTILGRITALKTIWALLPANIKDVIGKYTDADPTA